MQISQSQLSFVWLGAIATLIATFVGVLLLLSDDTGSAGVVAAESRPSLASYLALDDRQAMRELPIEQFLPSAVLDIESSDAIRRNLALPINKGANPLSPPFDAEWLGAGRDAGIKCLATAIYYEAASEPVAGQRAVAQVVLNRLRNPRYPKTICEVVYQGAKQSTGCQFSFACDGSLRRAPTGRAWMLATAVAISILSGNSSVEAGQATHYHTLTVFPAWAPELAKIGVLGNHVFYRPPQPAVYSYDAFRRARPIDAPALQPALAADGKAQESTGLTAAAVTEEQSRSSTDVVDRPDGAGVSRIDPPASADAILGGAALTTSKDGGRPATTIFPQRSRPNQQLPLASQ